MNDNHFFWLGDPENRFMTTEEYNEAVKQFRHRNTEDDAAGDTDGVVATISRSARDGDRIDVV